MLLVSQNIDIKHYSKLNKYLKQQSIGYQAKRTKILTKQQVLQFIHEAPDEKYLMDKVVLIFGIFCGCRRMEFVKMLVDHVDDRGSVFVITIQDRTDKTRMFTIVKEEEIDYLHLIRKYMSLRPKNCETKRFFIHYRNGRCLSQAVGKNAFGKIPRNIATYLKLTDANKYTGHCFRRTSVTS